MFFELNASILTYCDISIRFNFKLTQKFIKVKTSMLFDIVIDKRTKY